MKTREELLALSQLARRAQIDLSSFLALEARLPPRELVELIEELLARREQPSAGDRPAVGDGERLHEEDLEALVSTVCRTREIGGTSIKILNHQILRMVDEIHDRRRQAPDHERLLVQLAGCDVAALGGTKPSQAATPDMYGWSPAYGSVLKLRQAYDLLTTLPPDRVLSEFKTIVVGSVWTDPVDGVERTVLTVGINGIGYEVQDATAVYRLGENTFRDSFRWLRDPVKKEKADAD